MGVLCLFCHPCSSRKTMPDHGVTRLTHQGRNGQSKSSPLHQDQDQEPPCAREQQQHHSRSRLSLRSPTTETKAPLQKHVKKKARQRARRNRVTHAYGNAAGSQTHPQQTATPAQQQQNHQQTQLQRQPQNTPDASEEATSARASVFVVIYRGLLRCVKTRSRPRGVKPRELRGQDPPW